MVKIGDEIITEEGLKGTITDILMGNDGRYIIVFKDDGCPHHFKEGDIKFNVKDLKKKGVI